LLLKQQGKNPLQNIKREKARTNAKVWLAKQGTKP
jgi:hypothetical protein